MVKARRPEGAQSVGRALRLLKAFSRRHPELSLAELCDRTELTRTTGHRLLAALESEGLVQRNPTTGRYRLGPAVIGLGSLALQSSDVRAVAQPELEALAAETGETVTLEVLSDGRTLILSELSGQHLVTVAAEIGTRWPLHATSTGKALLACLGASERKRLLVPPLERYTPATITDLRELAAELEQVEARGYAMAIEELEPGAVAVAVALRDASGGPVAAISVGGPANRLSKAGLEELGRRLLVTVERLAGKVG